MELADHLAYWTVFVKAHEGVDASFKLSFTESNQVCCIVGCRSTCILKKKN